MLIGIIAVVVVAVAVFLFVKNSPKHAATVEATVKTDAAKIVADAQKAVTVAKADIAKKV